MRDKREKLFQDEIEPHILRVRERNRRRGLKNTLYDYNESRKSRYSHSGSMSLICLVKAGIPYPRACEMLKR